MRRPLAVILSAGTVVGFVLLARAVWGVPGLVGGWPVIALAAAAVSLALGMAFWDVRLSIGVAIDLALIALAIYRPEWTRRLIG